MVAPKDQQQPEMEGRLQAHTCLMPTARAFMSLKVPNLKICMYTEHTPVIFSVSFWGYMKTSHSLKNTDLVVSEEYN